MKQSELFEQITDSILSEMEKGNLTWRKTWASGLPANYITKATYQGINFVLLSFDNVSQPFYLTFLQAQQRKLKIKKGAKGRKIIFYKTLVETLPSGQTDTYPMLRFSSVFNLDDLEGFEFPTPTLSKPNEVLSNIISIHNPNIQHNTSECYYIEEMNLISTPTVNNFESEEEYFCTLFHELVHWTGHKSRLNRFERFSKQDKAFEELIAEIGATYLMGLCGIQNTLNNSSAYIGDWLKAGKLDKSFIPKAAVQASKAVNFLIGKTAAET